MEARYLIISLIALLGCRGPTEGRKTLTADQAIICGQQIANEKALALFNCKPFIRDVQLVKLNGTRWHWYCRAGFGSADIEDVVEFDDDGKNPKANVILLDTSPRRRLF